MYKHFKLLDGSIATESVLSRFFVHYNILLGEIMHDKTTRPHAWKNQRIILFKQVIITGSDIAQTAKSHHYGPS